MMQVEKTSVMDVGKIKMSVLHCSLQNCVSVLYET